MQRVMDVKEKTVDAKVRADEANTEAKTAKKDKKDAQGNTKKKEAARERVRVALEKSEQAGRDVWEAQGEANSVLPHLLMIPDGKGSFDEADAILKEVEKIAKKIVEMTKKTEKIVKPKATPELVEASAQASGEQPHQSGTELESAVKQ